MENFGGDLELKRLDLTWNGQVDSVDLTAATLRSAYSPDTFLSDITISPRQFQSVNKTCHLHLLNLCQINVSCGLNYRGLLRLLLLSFKTQQQAYMHK